MHNLVHARDTPVGVMLHICCFASLDLHATCKTAAYVPQPAQ